MLKKKDINNKISIKIISSGDSGILLNELYIPDEMIINNKTVEFNNTIVPSGQSITLIWNNLDNCCEGMFFINKNILNNHTNSIIEEINLSEFDPNYIKTMKDMFLNQTNLKKINIKITNYQCNNMYRMFQNCTSLEYIDLSSFTFNKYSTYDMRYMFSNCKNLKSILFPSEKYQLSNLYMDNMFSFCEKLESIDLSNFNITGNIDFNCHFVMIIH